MNIKQIEKHLMENDYVSDATFTGVDDLGNKTFKITTFDGIKEAWEIRKDNTVYYYNDSEDEWEHVDSIKVDKK